MEVRKEAIKSFIRIYSGTKENEDIDNYLTVLRNECSKGCWCGGHAIIKEKNEASLNDAQHCLPLEDVCSSFFMKQGNDEELSKNCFKHNSILLAAFVKGGKPNFSDNHDVMCNLSSSSGTYSTSNDRLHRGLYMKSSDYIQIQKSHKEPLCLVHPNGFLCDFKTKMKHYSENISPFEMRDLFVAGFTERKYYYFWENESNASMVNQGDVLPPDILFYPSYGDDEFLEKVYSEGPKVLKEKSMSLISIYICPDHMDIDKKKKGNAYCRCCDSVELLGTYGSDYFFEPITRH